MAKGFHLAGWQKVSLNDFPGRPCSVLFCAGCPFRCPFCYNRDLVLPERIALNREGIDWETVRRFIEKRRATLGAVCVTGGEPLAAEAGVELLRAVRALGVEVKLDTNGYYPERLSEVLSGKLVDCVAMDIKNCPARYAESCGMETMDLDRIAESIGLLLGSGIQTEFRTTVVRDFHREADLIAIADWGLGAEPIVFSSYEANPNVIRPGLSAYSREELRAIVGRIRRSGRLNVRLRGEFLADDVIHEQTGE